MMIIHKPQSGDYRVDKVFAIWPRKIDVRRDAWFQYVYSAEEYLVNNWSRIGYFLTRKEADEAIKHKKEKFNAHMKKDHWAR